MSKKQGTSPDSDFDFLFRQHHDRLFTLAMRMAGRRELAEEILQEAFLSAFTHYNEFRGECSPYTWLYRIVLNEGRKTWRTMQRLPVERTAAEHQISQAEVYAHINSGGPSEEEALVNQVRESCLQVFMNCMPSRYRAVFTLRQILHFDVRQTADILGITPTTVKVNLSRARRVIAEHLSGRCSLAHPDGLCDCRLYAGHIHRTGKQNKLQDIEVIRKKENAARLDMQRELREILQIEDLYDCEIKAPEYEVFCRQVKELRARKDLKILRYE